MMKQFQIEKTNLSNVQILNGEKPETADGEVLLRVERFGLSANNITYAVAGDTLGYWQFFPPLEAGTENWGVMPVWGFGEVIESKTDEILVGERLFGYFPPATYLKMKPTEISKYLLVDGSAHRAQLPKGYNVYRRVDSEPGYDRAGDDTRMLLFPLYLTSFALWDQMKEQSWYGAEQVILISASSKTSIGLAYALESEKSSVSVTGLTSRGNMEFVSSLGIYDNVVNYDDVETVSQKPSVIVDMAGNGDLLGHLHTYLGDHMRQTLSVGLTHWDTKRRSSDVIKDRTEFFFAPSQIQKRIKEWGSDEFNKRTAGFVQQAAIKSSQWLNMRKLDGLEGLNSVYSDVLEGKMKPEDGLLIEMPL